MTVIADRAREFAATLARFTPEQRAEWQAAIQESAAEITGDTPEEAVQLETLALAADTGRATPPVVVTAGGGSRIRRMAAVAGRPAPSPENQPARQGSVLLAAGSPGMPAGAPFESREQLAQATSDLLNSLDRKGTRGRVLLASARWTYPEDRQLKPDDWAHNERVFAQAIGSRPFLSLAPDALVASGGVCAPVNVDYSVPTWATADRPLRDALPAFQADRGGINYVPPPDIGDYAAQTGYAAATTVWTEATDANPAGATKPVVQVVCGSPVTVYVNAVPTRLGFGNMTARFAPEQTAANTDVAIAMAARTAEIELLQLIAASCVADVTASALLGACRDLLVTIEQVVAGYRNRHRVPESVKFTAIFPSYVRSIIRADLAREIGHSQNDWNSLAITDEQIDDMLTVRGVNPVYHLDGQTASQLSGAGGASQLYGAQSASGAVNPFPNNDGTTKLVWYIFPEGAFQFLDAGRLDLGVVRDSTLDATNDYEVFVEPFEGIAFRGVSSGALQMVSTLTVNGGTAGTISTSGDTA